MSEQKEWWRGAVIYQIYPRSFADSNGDGIGDLGGIVARIEHVARLGAEAVWISPFFTSPMKDFGYDVSDYCGVDPIFGSIDDFREVLRRAHDLGLKVLIDQVWSHSSDKHPWFAQSRSSRDNARHDWYVWSDPKPDGTPPNNWLSYFGGPSWTWDARREQYYLHHFLDSQPAMNLWNPEVRRAVKEVAGFWLDLGVDGFRLDAIHTYLSDKTLRDNPACKPGLSSDMPSSSPLSRQTRLRTANLPENYEWAEEIAAHIRKWPDRAVLAEVGGDDAEREIGRYTSGARKFEMAYSFGLVGSPMTKASVLANLEKVEEKLEDGWVCWAISNHDFRRVASRVKGNAPAADRAVFASVLALCLRGSYCMYQGEELGLPQAELAFEDLVDPYDISLYPEHVGRDGCRTPMPWFKDAPHAGFSTALRTWLPVPPEHAALAADVQENDPASVLSFLRAFLAWRKTAAAVRFGGIEVLEAPGEVVMFARRLGGDVVTCVFNCGDESAALPRPAGTRVGAACRNAEEEGSVLKLAAFGFAVYA